MSEMKKMDTDFSGAASPPSQADKGTLVTLPMIQGHMAMWVYRQHPFNDLSGVNEINDALKASTGAWLTPTILPMQYFRDRRDVMAWLHRTLDGHPIISQWNAPRVNRGQEFAFSSRHGKTAPEYDFVDIDALFRNVAFGAFDEAWRDDNPDSRITHAVAQNDTEKNKSSLSPSPTNQSEREG